MLSNFPPSIEVTEPPGRFPSGYADGVHHMNNSKTRFMNPWPYRDQTYSDWLSVRSFTANIGHLKVLGFTQIFFIAIPRSPDIPRDIKSSIPAQSSTWGTESGNEDSAKATWL
ncbi:hypothetical protein EDB87DRAFT_1596274, partial [Lactarius vividus]